MSRQPFLCLLFAACCCLSTSSIAQNQPWAPAGARWYYCQGTGLGAPECSGYFFQEAAGDTIIAGQNCRILRGYEKNWLNQQSPLADRYTFTRNDSVYFFQPDSNRFLLTYDFSAAVGDTLEFPAPQVSPWEPDDTSFRVRVDSIVRRPAGLDSLRFFYVSPLEWENWGFYGGWYAEKIGGRNRVTPFPTVTIPEIDGFIRCYSDQTAEIKFSNQVCDFTATSWFDPAAEWTYGVQDWQFQGYEKMTVTGDTTLLGRTCKKISRQATGKHPTQGIKTIDLGEHYVYEAYDKAYVWQVNKFILLYDFNLKPGDTLRVEASACPRFFVIDSVGQTQIQGVSLRHQKGRLLPAWPLDILEEITLIERLGQVYARENGADIPKGYFFTQESWACLTDLPFKGLRCYTDSDIDLFMTSSVPCDFIVATGTAETAGVEIFPNPVGVQLSIRLADAEANRHFTLFDALGRRALAGVLPEAENVIPTAGLAPGVYLLQIWMEGGIIVREILKL